MSRRFMGQSAIGTGTYKRAFDRDERLDDDVVEA